MLADHTKIPYNKSRFLGFPRKLIVWIFLHEFDFIFYALPSFFHIYLSVVSNQALVEQMFM